MTDTAAAHAGSTGPTAARHRVAGAADRWSQLVDHSWLLLEDVLFCVAGSRHTTTEVTGCAYWIKAPLARRLQRQLPSHVRKGARTSAPLLYAGATYIKLPALAPSQAWPAMHAALAGIGIRRVESSLLATAQLSAARGRLDPADALRAAAALPDHGHDCGLRVLHRLLAAVGDPSGDGGLLGLTGSAAFDPLRLCGGGDVDLLIYGMHHTAGAPSLPEILVHAGISELGGIRLADLPAADPRRTAYGGSRLFPAGRPGPHRDRIWGRRRDVAWIGDVRLDLTLVPAAADLVDELPYAGAVQRPVAGLVQLDSVAAGYPARLTARADGRPVEIWVTARGFDGALQPDDRVRLAGAARRISRGGAVITVDDVPSHHLQLEAQWPT